MTTKGVLCGLTERWGHTHTHTHILRLPSTPLLGIRTTHTEDIHQPAGGQQAARRSTTEPKDKAKLTQDANAAGLGSKKIPAYLQDPFFLIIILRDNKNREDTK
jgi:hypothetical protein